MIEERDEPAIKENQMAALSPLLSSQNILCELSLLRICAYFLQMGTKYYFLACSPPRVLNPGKSSPLLFFLNSFFTPYSSKSVEKQQHIITVSGMSVVANVCNSVRCGWCSDTWAISILPQSLGTFIHDTYLKSNYRKITDFMVSVHI